MRRTSVGLLSITWLLWVALASGVSAQPPEAKQATPPAPEAKQTTPQPAEGKQATPPTSEAKQATPPSANASVPAAKASQTQASPDAPLPASQVEETRRNRLSESYWYYLLITLLFAAIVLPFTMAIAASVYRGQSEFNAENRPLGLPVGSVRSILAYSLIGYLGFFVLTSVLSVSRFDPPEFLLGIIATVIGFYFGSRTGEDAEARASRTGTVRGIVQQGTVPVRGALVTFKRSADNVEAYTRITDVDGRFELPGALPGKYVVKAGVAGSTPSDEQQVSVVAGSDHEVLLSIKPATQPPPAPPKP